MLKLQNALNQGQALADKMKNYIEVFFQPFQVVFSCPQQAVLTTGFLLLPHHLLEPRCKTGRSSWLLKIELTLKKSFLFQARFWLLLLKLPAPGDFLVLLFLKGSVSFYLRGAWGYLVITPWEYPLHCGVVSRPGRLQ